MDRRLDRICKRLWSNKESGTSSENTDIREVSEDTKRKKPNFSIDYILFGNANRDVEIKKSDSNEDFTDL
jgi:hypothetical protein